MSAVPPARIRSRKAVRFAGFSAVLMIALVWNAAVLRVVHSVLLSGGPWDLVDWSVFLVVLPFALAGLALIGLAIYLGVPLLNPRVTIEIDPPVAVLGEPIDVSWQFDGAVARIPRLIVRLEGREEVLAPKHTGRGPAMIAERRVFRRIGVIQSSSAEEISRGSTTLRIPRDSMPSFSGRGSRVAWYVCLYGGSDRWPHVRQELEFVVRPLPLLT